MPRLPTCALALAAVLMLGAAPAHAADPDGDGLPSKWEQGKTKSVENLKKLGAKPSSKDIFIELDYADGAHQGDVPCSELKAFTDAMAGGPVNNPSGPDGVRLHIDAGQNCPGPTDYDFGGSQHVSIGSPCLNPSDLNAAPFKPKRFKEFHHALLVPGGGICGGAAGVATDTDFLVDKQGGGDFGHVAMHELGHTLGLDHGPINSSYSVMSGLINKQQSPYDQILDYNRYPIEALDESALSEADGLESTPAGENFLSGVLVRYYCGPANLHQLSGGADANVDWDCDDDPYFFPPMPTYTIDPGTVAADINGNGTVGDVIPAQPNEWAGLGYGNGRIGG